LPQHFGSDRPLEVGCVGQIYVRSMDCIDYGLDGERQWAGFCKKEHQYDNLTLDVACGDDG